MKDYRRYILPGLLYMIFFLSGAAALVYEVIWVRELSLVFGGSHLAISTVLSVYMAGLAIGSYFLGRFADRSQKNLMLYGLLEIGIGLTALLSFWLVKLYPQLYIHLARGRDDSYLYISAVRILFAIVTLITPTFLMGGTLPVLSKCVPGNSGRFLSNISFLYGFNTLGAVVGTILTGFVLLPNISVTYTLFLAVFCNIALGIISIALQKKAGYFFAESHAGEAWMEKTVPERPVAIAGPGNLGEAPYKMVLWGIGISGFCALGYEVLWSRILAIVVGATVYGFAIMLAAFLAGIALGSSTLGLFKRIFPKRFNTLGGLIFSFGAVQVLIGILALAVTIMLRNLPANSLALKEFFRNRSIDFFVARQWSDIILSFFYMVIPAFFMGAAFPIAGAVQTGHIKKIGRGVGQVLTFNTVGSILGAVLSGFLFVYLFGTERSLQFLALMNAGLGLLVIVSLKRSRLLLRASAAAVVAIILFLLVNPGLFRVWDRHYFAIFQANTPEAFSTPALVREVLHTTDVLYYKEGVEATVSSIRRKWGEQSFVINGRVEASTILADRQVQYTLGHLPMLLSPHPRNVLVIGLGSGMTAGATTVHPKAEKVTLAEFEPAMLGVARTFSDYNHNVLDSPKLKIVINDGRNFLLTTKEKFDVITADPIHPWFRGAGYLYTDEYFKLASRHMTRTGVICQWLPIYELSIEDLKSVVRTFQQNFKYSFLWITHWDSIIVGSNFPIALDEAELERRISVPAVKADLESVFMGSADDFLSYFVMGTDGMVRFGRRGVLNTDDNLYLEFSAPLSMERGFLTGTNSATIARYRESIVKYLPPLNLEMDWGHLQKWHETDQAGAVYDLAHALFLNGNYESPQFRRSMELLEKKYPDYAPGKLLRNICEWTLDRIPHLYRKIELPCITKDGKTTSVELVILKTKMSPSAVFVDFGANRQQVQLGRSILLMDKDDDGNVDEELAAFVDRFVKEVKTAYNKNKLTSPYGIPRRKKLDEMIISILNHYEEKG